MDFNQNNNIHMTIGFPIINLLYRGCPFFKYNPQIEQNYVLRDQGYPQKYICICLEYTLSSYI